LGLASPWFGAREYRERMAQGAHFSTIIVLTRDRGEGRVTLDRYGEPVIDYVTSVYDRQHLKHGLSQAARIHFAAGASSVVSLHSKKTMLERSAGSKVTQQQFNEFDRQLERHGMGVNRLMMFTAHQMGTCRMGSDPGGAVVNGNGEVYGVNGLFVCDGSVFLWASGF